jgi:predicted kinase
VRPSRATAAKERITLPIAIPKWADRSAQLSQHSYSVTMTTWVLFAGLPGTGKSTLARALAERLGAAVLDKDRVRGALFPGVLTDYSTEQDQLCMRAMLESAVYLTERQRSAYIFFDGRTFSRQIQIEEVLRVAERAGARWRIVHLTCTDAVAEERLARNDPAHPAKNRDPALYRTIKQHFEPIQQATLAVDTTLGVEGQLAVVEGYLKTLD